MIDAMSIIGHALGLQSKLRPDIEFTHDVFTLWPTRVFTAAQALRGAYGKDTPPSPWRPIIVVYDQPDPKATASGLKIRSWKNLYKQGPRDAGGVTLGWAQTFVDQSAAERYRSDREMLYMLDLLKRDHPERRQVLVTGDPGLSERASPYAEVRSPKWFIQELKEAGPSGERAIKGLMGDASVTGPAFKCLPRAVMKAFQLR